MAYGGPYIPNTQATNEEAEAELEQYAPPVSPMYVRLAQAGAAMTQKADIINVVKDAGQDIGEFVKGAAVSAAKAAVGSGMDVANTIGNAEVKGAKALGITPKVGTETNQQQFGKKLTQFGGEDTAKQFAGNVAQVAAIVVSMAGAGKAVEEGGEFLLKQIGEQGVKDLADKAGIDSEGHLVSELAERVAGTGPGQDAIKALTSKATPIGERIVKSGAEGAAVGGTFGAGQAASQNGNAKQILKGGIEGAAAGAALGAAGTVAKAGLNRYTGKTANADEVRATAAKHQATENIAAETTAESELPKSSSRSSAVDELKNAAKKANKGLGESGSVNPGEATKNVKDFLDNYSQAKKSSGDVVKDVTSVRNKAALLQHDAAEVGKGFSTTQADREAADKYLEARGAGLSLPKLTKAQQQIVDNADALKKETDKDKATLAKETRRPAKETGNGVHRIALGKNSPLERFMKGDRKSPVNSRSMRTTVDSNQARKLYALTDEDGNRTVAHIANQTVKNEDGRIVSQGKMVTRLENAGKKSTPLGRLKLTTNEDQMDKELQPIKKQLDNLDQEKRILSATKGRTAAASQRLANIEDNISSLNRDYANTLNKYDINDLDDKKFTAKDGTTYTVGQATKDEITKATGQKYLIHPEMAALDDMVRTKQALYNAQILSKWKDSPDFDKIAVEQGHDAPKGWKSVNMPQLKGYQFEPHVADMLNMLFNNADTDDDWISKANRQLRNAIVAVPIKHTGNEAITNLVDRGVSALLPNKVIAQSKNVLKAMDEVHNFGPLWRQVLESGAHMTSADSDSFGKMVQEQLEGLMDHPQASDDLKKVISAPVQAYKAFQRGTVWVAQDVLNMSRILDRMDEGQSLDDAIHDTEKFNLAYQVPPKVLGSTKIANVLRGSNSILFGSYRYDLFRINANYLKDAVKISDPKTAAKAVDSLAMEALVVAGFATAVKSGVEKLTGNRNAYMTAPGVAGLAEDVWELASGRETTETFGSQQIYPSWLLSDGMQVLNNQDSFTDEPIYNQYASKPQQFKQVVGWLASQLPTPIEMPNTSNKVIGAALSVLGVRAPKDSSAETEFESLYYDQSESTYDQVKSLAKAGKTAQAISTGNQYNQLLAASYKSAWNDAHPDNQITTDEAASKIQSKYDSNWIDTSPSGIAKLKKPSTSLVSQL